jgi:pyrroloquinoline-quinone synthase
MRQESLQQIEKQIAARHTLNHPFYQAWQRGELSREALADYAMQYYHHVAAFPTYLSALHSHTTDAETRRAVLQNLIDEEAGRPNHPDLWLQFAEGLGLRGDAVKSGMPQPETRALVETFQGVCRDGSVAAGLAALYSYESQIPAVAATKIDGLKRHYGIASDAHLAYFAVHEVADVEHAAVERGLLQRHLCDDDSADAAVASLKALDGVWSLLTGVCERHGIAC